MRRPPWLLEPVNVWRKRLDDARVHGSPTRILTDIVMLVRYALGLDETLEPLPICDHLAVNVEVTRRDLQEVQAFADPGGMVRARMLFGNRRDNVLDDLSGALVA